MDALGLAQLHRRVQDAALSANKRRDAHAVRAGFRRSPGKPRGVGEGGGVRNSAVGGSVDNKYGLMDSIDVEALKLDRRLGAEAVAAERTSTWVGGGVTGVGVGEGGSPPQRTDYKGGGARRRFMDLAEVQQRAAVLLQERAQNAPMLEAKRQERIHTLGKCAHLTSLLTTELPTLDQARYLLTQQPPTASTSAYCLASAHRAASSTATHPTGAMPLPQGAQPKVAVTPEVPAFSAAEEDNKLRAWLKAHPTAQKVPMNFSLFSYENVININNHSNLFLFTFPSIHIGLVGCA